MANRDLLKEAIADAKALKETAIANAKAALEEAFEPRLKSMLSAKLEEMENEEVEEGYGKDKDDMKEETSEPHGNIGAQTPEGEPLGFLEEEDDTMDEEMNLDEILAELELDEEEGQDITEAEGVEEDIYEAEEDEEEEESEEPEGEDEEAEGEEEEIDLEDMSEEDLKKFIEDVIEDMVEAGELEPGDQFEDDVEVEVDAEGELDIEDDSKTAVDENQQVNESDMVLQAAEMLRDSGLVDPENAMAAAKAAIAAGASAPAIIGALASAVKDKMSKKKAANEVEIDEINELKSELHEVNLLNAKLLYSNKIFRAQNLQEAQKVKVLEAFDKAETVKEAKLIFETMSTNLTPVRTKKKQMVKENLGRASKATGVAPQTRSNIVDVDPQFARMQKLAGLR